LIEHLWIGFESVTCVACSPFSVLEGGLLFVGEVLSSLFSFQKHGSDSCKVYESLFFSHGNSSFEWSKVLRSSNDRFWHVTVFDGDNPSNTLSLLDESCSAVESAVRHTHLLATVEDNGYPVAFLIVVHNTADVDSATLALTST
jgi:hypothetical protein